MVLAGGGKLPPRNATARGSTEYSTKSETVDDKVDLACTTALRSPAAKVFVMVLTVG